MCNVAGIVYFNPAETQNVTVIVTNGYLTMKPELGPVCRGRMHSGTCHSPGLNRTHVRPSLAYRQNLLSFLTTEHHSTLQLILS